ncbi:1-acyl-sn-glycerol-3-phosphate acyltransferase [Oleispira antarctica RB-8]|uniref:1-acyl-sn-glycerol-3-phosphate acyltransferase n=1 Tax=Oleispira antarctica RB-8 TaxID=698738 RepID=R4YNB3_OLEAN|nr:1-acyl-sn-glycerol-3-phosphate acyltransferase [Oleispira antarctica RB-8]
MQSIKKRLRSSWRLLRLSQNLLLIIIVVPIIFSPFGLIIPKRRKIAGSLYRNCYKALNIQLVITGSPTSEPALWVCNHISWLDILLLAGNNCVDFVAKSEVADWPVIGGVIRRTGTLFIDRDNKFKAYRALPELQQRLESGTSVLIFPEGTTSTGETCLPFKPMFYQAAIRTNMLIQPVSLCYEHVDGSPCTDVAFIGDDEFSISFKQILNKPKIIAHITYLPAMKAEQWHRKEMASLNQQHINLAINKQTCM